MKRLALTTMVALFLFVANSSLATTTPFDPNQPPFYTMAYDELASLSSAEADGDITASEQLKKYISGLTALAGSLKNLDNSSWQYLQTLKGKNTWVAEDTLEAKDWIDFQENVFRACQNNINKITCSKLGMLIIDVFEMGGKGSRR